MKFMGIHFAPLRIPLERRLQTICAFLEVFFTTYLSVYSLIVSVCLLINPAYWTIFIPYILWIAFDRKTPCRGGRPNSWVRSRSIFQYAKDYYPVKLQMPTNEKFDPKKNYLLCFFPHGTITTGPTLSFLFKTQDGEDPLPNHDIIGITLNGSFYVPFYREVLLSFGFCSANSESINYILGTPQGGKALGLIVGGAAEAFYSGEKDYHVVLKKRKGFVKLALKNGAPLVPCFSFGENRLFKVYAFSEGTWMRRLQEWIQKKMGAAPIFIYGRGFLQYTFGCVPFRTPVTVVVGDPIDVPKVENPTNLEIDLLHSKFVASLRKIFEENKHKFEKNPQECDLIIN